MYYQRESFWSTASGGGGGTGTVTNVSVTTANGVSGIVTDPTGAAQIALTLGAITPTSVNGNTITAGTGTLTLGAVTLNAGPGGTLGTAAFTSAGAYEVPLTFSGGLTRTVNTITPGAITPISAAFSGTAGAGFISLLTQSSDPSAPASGFALFANSTGRFSWRNAADGFTRSFEVTATANRVFTIPNADFTFAGLGIAQTFSAANTFSANGALSTPAVSITGTPITGGTGTTTQGLLKVGGGTSGGLSTSGTMLEIQAPTGFAGRLIEAQVNGTSYFISSSSGLTVNGSVNLTSLGNQFSITGDTILSRKASANWQLGASDAAAPVAQTLSVQSVVPGTLDTSGQDASYNGSRGTGTGSGGGHIFYTSRFGSSGTSQNSLTRTFSVYGNGGVSVGAGGPTVSALLIPVSGASSTYAASGTGLCLYSYATEANGCALVISGTSSAQTTGISQSIYVGRTFAPTSGSAQHRTLELSSTINQTGGANGITRGLYINPTLTAAADWRAIEVSSGVVQIASSLTTASVTGTDQNGTTMTLSPGVGTGTGRAGDRVTKTGNTTTTGTTAHTLSTRCYESAKFVDLTPATATTLFTVTVGTNNYIGITIDCTIFAAHGGELQVLHSVVNVGAGNKAGTLTMGLAQVDGAATNTSGTLTPVTYTAVDNGSGVLAIKVNATTSLSGTPTTLRAKWQARFNSNDAATVTAS